MQRTFRKAKLSQLAKERAEVYKVRFPNMDRMSDVVAIVVVNIVLIKQNF